MPFALTSCFYSLNTALMELLIYIIIFIVELANESGYKMDFSQLKISDCCDATTEYAVSSTVSEFEVRQMPNIRSEVYVKVFRSTVLWNFSNRCIN